MIEFKKPPNLFQNQYASFRQDVITFLIQNLPGQYTVLDPMAGSAPLLPFMESQGRNAIFCDFLPIYYYLNLAKTIDVYKAYVRHKEKNRRFLIKLVSSLLNPLSSQTLAVSEGWLNDEVLEQLCEAWKKTSNYSPDLCKILRAALILSVRHFSTFSKSSNLTWMKMGGVSNVTDINVVSKDVTDKIERFYAQTYSRLPNSGLVRASNCTILSANSEEAKYEKQRYIVISSPSFPNRYDHVQSYYPELYFLHRADHCPHPNTIKERILATNKVSKFKISDEVVALVQNRSESAFNFIQAAKTNVPKNRVQQENNYYFRYYLRYYFHLFHYLDNIRQYTIPGSEYFIVVQANIHRGEVNFIHDYLVEYFKSFGFESRIVKSWPRSHQGRRNISHHHPLVLKKHQESIVWSRIGEQL